VKIKQLGEISWKNFLGGGGEEIFDFLENSAPLPVVLSWRFKA